MAEAISVYGVQSPRNALLCPTAPLWLSLKTFREKQSDDFRTVLRQRSVGSELPRVVEGLGEFEGGNSTC